MTYNYSWHATKTLKVTANNAMPYTRPTDIFEWIKYLSAILPLFQRQNGSVDHDLTTHFLLINPLRVDTRTGGGSIRSYLAASPILITSTRLANGKRKSSASSEKDADHHRNLIEVYLGHHPNAKSTQLFERNQAKAHWNIWYVSPIINTVAKLTIGNSFCQLALIHAPSRFWWA